MNKEKVVEESEKLVKAAFKLKNMLSNHKNAYKWETYFGDERDGKDYRIKVHIEQVILDHTKTKVKHVVPPRLKNQIN